MFSMSNMWLNCSQSCMCWRTILDWSLQACSEVRSNNVLSVFPMYEQPHPGHDTLYTTFDLFKKGVQSFTFRISWMRSLVSRAKKICDQKYLQDELKNINTFAAWNNYPGRIRNSLIRRFCTDRNDTHAHSPMQSYPLVQSFSGYSATYGMLLPTD